MPLTQAIGPWHEFYTLLGAASATMVALLFVAASVGAGAFTTGRRAGLRMFLSASVVHFSSILAVCLIAVAPIQGWGPFGLIILICGGFGLGYSVFAWRDIVREGLYARIDLEDRVWYAILPAVGYLLETVSGIMLSTGRALGCPTLAVSAGVLLVVGIHNAWDITVWSITRRRE